MLWVSELTVARWTPCADALDSAVRATYFLVCLLSGLSSWSVFSLYCVMGSGGFFFYSQSKTLSVI